MVRVRSRSFRVQEFEKRRKLRDRGEVGVVAGGETIAGLDLDSAAQMTAGSADVAVQAAAQSQRVVNMICIRNARDGLGEVPFGLGEAALIDQRDRVIVVLFRGS